MSQKRQKENPRKIEFMRKYNREKLVKGNSGKDEAFPFFHSVF